MRRLLYTDRPPTGEGADRANIEIPLRFIEFQFGERPSGSVRRMNRDEAMPHLEPVYRAYAEPANGMLQRGKIIWDLMLKRSEGQNVWIGICFDRAGEARGYSLYKTRFVWLDMEAYRGLWSYLAGHDLLERIRFDYVAEDDPAPNLFLESRRLRRTHDGVWMRVVDAADALGKLGYDLPGEAVIEVVEDELCPWNNGCYRLAVSDDDTEVEKLPGRANPDLAVRPEALSSLVAGHNRASDLARMGRAAIPDDGRAAALDALFATRRRPHCPNMF